MKTYNLMLGIVTNTGPIWSLCRQRFKVIIILLDANDAKLSTCRDNMPSGMNVHVQDRLFIIQFSEALSGA